MAFGAFEARIPEQLRKWVTEHPRKTRDHCKSSCYILQVALGYMKLGGGCQI